MSVVPFPEPPPRLRYVIELEVHQNGNYDTTIRRADGQSLDSPEEREEVENAIRQLHWMVLNDNHPENRLVLVTAIYASSLVSTRWKENEFETTEQCLWLKRRLDEVHSQVDFNQEDSPMQPADVKHNAFTENLGTDWIAVDLNGSVICRSSTREAVEHAVEHTGAGDAVAFYTGADFDTVAPALKFPDEEPRGMYSMDQGATADLTGVDLEELEKAIDVEEQPAAPAIEFENHPDTGMVPVAPRRDPAGGAVKEFGRGATDVGSVTVEPSATKYNTKSDPRTMADGSAFDHDHDGKVGGSLPKANRKRKPAK